MAGDTSDGSGGRPGSRPGKVDAAPPDGDLPPLLDMKVPAPPSPDLMSLPDLAGPLDLSRPADSAIRCGNQRTCRGDQPLCCYHRNHGHFRCAVDESKCNANNDSIYHCDGAEDCAGGQVCCGTVDTKHAVVGTTCQPTCAALSPPLCHGRAQDCPANQGYTHCCRFGESGFYWCSKEPCR